MTLALLPRLSLRSIALLCSALFAVAAFPAEKNAGFAPLPAASSLRDGSLAAVPFDLETLKAGWRQRIRAVAASGRLPILDIESSFPAGRFDPARYSQDMDEQGVALTVFSAQAQGKWSESTRRLIAIDPSRYIPAGQAGEQAAWLDTPQAMLEDNETRLLQEGHPIMGEFEIRHYPSPRELRRSGQDRDVDVPIDGAVGHRLFQAARKTGRPFEIHYEIEDALLDPLEGMLRQYPDVKVIWCHVAQIRFQAKATRYNAAYVRRLIETYPNLYFDTAFGGPDSTYGPRGEYHARIWDREHGGIQAEWAQLIRDHPWRFVAALDIGGDRMDRLSEWTATLRRFLDALPPEAREIVAYKAAWKLLFNEDF